MIYNFIFSFKTNIAIKNHWNTSFKKRSVPKNNPQFGVNDTIKRSTTKKILVRSNKGLNVAVETSLENSDFNKLDDSGKNQFESKTMVREVGDSSKVLANEFANSGGVECKPKLSNLDFSSCNMENVSKDNVGISSKQISEKSRLNGKPIIE